MISKKQIPEKYKNIIEAQLEKYKIRVFTTKVDKIPNVDDIPTEQSAKWLKVKDVICVYVDMKNSTMFSASHHAATTGRIYTLFTGTAVRLFKSFDAQYIDIKGDGVFALFNFDQVYTAFASAVTFKTFVVDEFLNKAKSISKVHTGVHVGIDQSTLLVSKIGLRKHASRGDMHNEVWAGKTVNMASKLASLADENEIFVSPRFYENLKSRKAKYSCTCGKESPSLLWEKVDLSNDNRFSFSEAHVLKSAWCKNHGAEYLQAIIDADKNKS